MPARTALKVWETVSLIGAVILRASMPRRVLADCRPFFFWLLFLDILNLLTITPNKRRFILSHKDSSLSPCTLYAERCIQARKIQISARKRICKCTNYIGLRQQKNQEFCKCLIHIGLQLPKSRRFLVIFEICLQTWFGMEACHIMRTLPLRPPILTFQRIRHLWPFYHFPKPQLALY